MNAALFKGGGSLIKYLKQRVTVLFCGLPDKRIFRDYKNLETLEGGSGCSTNRKQDQKYEECYTHGEIVPHMNN